MSEANTERDQLLAALAWQTELGAGDAVADVPARWLDPRWGQESPKPDRPPALAATAAARGVERAPVPRTAPAPPPSRPPPSTAAKVAPEALSAVSDLAALASALKSFDGCTLKATAKNLCLYRGAERADLMIIGEAPGADEDREGKPFVGRAGQLLDRMLFAAGLDPAHVHITNVVYWRPPGNRTPTPEEIHACRPFLERQAAIVAPRLVLALGGTAMKALTDTEAGILKSRGKFRDLELGGRRVRLMASLHPAYLLRSPIAKRLAWRDFLSVAEALAKGAD